MPAAMLFSFAARASRPVPVSWPISASLLLTKRKTVLLSAHFTSSEPTRSVTGLRPAIANRCSFDCACTISIKSSSDRTLENSSKGAATSISSLASLITTLPGARFRGANNSATSARASASTSSASWQRTSSYFSICSSSQRSTTLRNSFAMLRINSAHSKLSGSLFSALKLENADPFPETLSTTTPPKNSTNCGRVCRTSMRADWNF